MQPRWHRALGSRRHALIIRAVFPSVASAILSLVFLTPVFALTDCTKPPDGAVTQLPSAATRWAHLECSKYGYKIVAADGWVWRNADRTPTLSRWSYFGGFDAGLGAYFVRVIYDPMLQAAKEELIKEFPHFAIPKRLAEGEVHIFQGRGSAGSEFKFIVLWSAEDMGWMYDLKKLPEEVTIVMARKNAVPRYKK
jgi:hypothetical protein